MPRKPLAVQARSDTRRCLGARGTYKDKACSNRAHVDHGRRGERPSWLASQVRPNGRGQALARSVVRREGVKDQSPPDGTPRGKTAKAGLMRSTRAWPARAPTDRMIGAVKNILKIKNTPPTRTTTHYPSRYLLKQLNYSVNYNPQSQCKPTMAANPLF